MAARQTTVVSTKGRIILPKAIRDLRQRSTGTRLVVEDTPEGVLSRAPSPFPRTTVDDVCGCLKYDCPPKTDADFKAGIEAEVKRRHERGRY